MNKRMIRNITRKTTAIIGTIAASSLLGLPVLAQTNSSPMNRSVECVPSNTQSSSTVNRSSSNTSTNTSVPGTAAGAVDVSPSGDASNTGAPVLPNQSDPRSTPATQGTISNEMGATTDGSISGQTSVSNTNRINSNTQSNRTTDTSTTYTAYEPSTSRSYRSQSYGVSTDPIYNNVLGWGGATAGAFANNMVNQASNPNWQGNETANRYQDSSDRELASINQVDDRQMQSSMSTSSEGVTSGAQVSSRDSMMGSSTSTSSGSTQANTCPPGMVPRTSSSNLQQSQSSTDQQYPTEGAARQRANPNQFQTPSNQ